MKNVNNSTRAALVAQVLAEVNRWVKGHGLNEDTTDILHKHMTEEAHVGELMDYLNQWKRINRLRGF